MRADSGGCELARGPASDEPDALPGCELGGVKAPEVEPTGLLPPAEDAMANRL